MTNLDEKAVSNSKEFVTDRAESIQLSDSAFEAAIDVLGREDIYYLLKNHTGYDCYLNALTTIRQWFEQNKAYLSNLPGKEVSVEEIAERLTNTKINIETERHYCFGNIIEGDAKKIAQQIHQLYNRSK